MSTFGSKVEEYIFVWVRLNRPLEGDLGPFTHGNNSGDKPVSTHSFMQIATELLPCTGCCVSSEYCA